MSRIRIALVSFDWRRSKDPMIALGHASVTASLRTLTQKYNLQVDDISYNMNSLEFKNPKNFDAFIENSIFDIFSRKPDIVALGAFVWNENCIQKIGSIIQNDLSIKKIILAGPQVSYAPKGTLENYYPFGSIFIRGYAEHSLTYLIESYFNNGFDCKPLIPGVHYAGQLDLGLQAQVDLNQIPSPFLGNHPIISTGTDQAFIRWESQRGCPFRCSFCQHRDQYTQRICKSVNRIYEEIDHFKENNVQDIAVLDPTFNSGPNYLQTLAKFKGFKGKLSLQCRFEMIRTEFVDLCHSLRNEGCDVRLEFGIQTTNALESKACRRSNQLSLIRKNAKILEGLAIPFEISLIYGLPHQTVSSFQQSIEFCRLLNPTKLVAWPLMLLRGTEMYERRAEFGLKEKVIDSDTNGARAETGIPHVVSSDSFNEKDWMQMREIADHLS